MFPVRNSVLYVPEIYGLYTVEWRDGSCTWYQDLIDRERVPTYAFGKGFCAGPLFTVPASEHPGTTDDWEQGLNGLLVHADYADALVFFFGDGFHLRRHAQACLRWSLTDLEYIGIPTGDVRTLKEFPGKRYAVNRFEGDPRWHVLEVFRKLRRADTQAETEKEAE